MGVSRRGHNGVNSCFADRYTQHPRHGRHATRDSDHDEPHTCHVPSTKRSNSWSAVRFIPGQSRVRNTSKWRSELFYWSVKAPVAPCPNWISSQHLAVFRRQWWIRWWRRRALQWEPRVTWERLATSRSARLPQWAWPRSISRRPRRAGATARRARAEGARREAAAPRAVTPRVRWDHRAPTAPHSLSLHTCTEELEGTGRRQANPACPSRPLTGLRPRRCGPAADKVTSRPWAARAGTLRVGELRTEPPAGEHPADTPLGGWHPVMPRPCLTSTSVPLGILFLLTDCYASWTERELLSLDVFCRDVRREMTLWEIFVQFTRTNDFKTQKVTTQLDVEAWCLLPCVCYQLVADSTYGSIQTILQQVSLPQSNWRDLLAPQSGRSVDCLFLVFHRNLIFLPEEAANCKSPDFHLTTGSHQKLLGSAREKECCFG